MIGVTDRGERGEATGAIATVAYLGLSRKCGALK
jgi:hypothetical protein